jgi:hypothetical protein
MKFENRTPLDGGPQAPHPVVAGGSARRAVGGHVVPRCRPRRIPARRLVPHAGNRQGLRLHLQPDGDFPSAAKRRGLRQRTMGVVKHYQMEIAELGGHAHAEFWGKHNRAPDTDDAGDVAELMRTAERIMRTAGWGWSKEVQRDAEGEVVGWEDADERAMWEALTKND